MNLYIYPIQQNPTQKNLIDFRRLISDSLIAAETWEKLDRTFTVQQDVKAYLFSHKQNQYKNEPFYLWYSESSIKVIFEIDEDENSKSMIIGMLIYYLLKHHTTNIRKIEIK